LIRYSIPSKEKTEGRCHVGPDVRPSHFTSIDYSGDVKRGKDETSSPGHSVTLLEEKSRMQCKGDLAAGTSPLHGAPNEWEVQYFIRDRDWWSVGPEALNRYSLAVIGYFVPARDASRSGPWGISNDEVVLFGVGRADRGADAAQAPSVVESGGLADLPKDVISEVMAEPQLLDGARFWVKLNRHQVETERRKSEGGFINVKTSQLFVEDRPDICRVWSNVGGSPLFGDKLSEHCD